jgi:hypothetical protein
MYGEIKTAGKASQVKDGTFARSQIEAKQKRGSDRGRCERMTATAWTRRILTDRLTRNNEECSKESEKCK